MTDAEGANGVFGEQAGLVEAALPVFGAMEGNGNDQQVEGRFGGKAGDGEGEQAAEGARGGG